MSARARLAAALIGLSALVLPSSALANVLDIPAAAPPQFRALLRAKLHMPPPHSGFESRFDLEAKHGYKVSVVGEGNIVAVEVTKPLPHGKENLLEQLVGSKQAVTAYVTRGIVTEHRIAASFGRLGKIDVRFRPSGRVVESRPGRRCRGTDHLTRQLGVFVGGIRFSGEKHYVAVRSHRAKGRVRTPLHLHCASIPRGVRSDRRARPVPHHTAFNPTFFAATRRHGVSSVELLTLGIGRTTLFAAVTEEGLATMARIRFALTTTHSSKAVVLNDPLTKATITPPAPFRGKGTYRAAPDGTTTWTGPLSVTFPGAPRMPLTGEDFETTLEAGF